MQGILYRCGLVTVNLSKWNVSNVTTLYEAFGSRTLTTINFDNWHIPKLTNIKNMFYDADKITRIDTSTWTGGVPTQLTDTYYMTSSCKSLQYLDLSGIPIKVTEQRGFLYEANSLQTLILSNCDFGGVTYLKYAWTNLGNLKEVVMHNCTPASINYIIGRMPTKTEANPGTFKIGDLDASTINATALANKYWNVVNE